MMTAMCLIVEVTAVSFLLLPLRERVSTAPLLHTRIPCVKTSYRIQHKSRYTRWFVLKFSLRNSQNVKSCFL